MQWRENTKCGDGNSENLNYKLNIKCKYYDKQQIQKIYLQKIPKSKIKKGENAKYRNYKTKTKIKFDIQNIQITIIIQNFF